jgi:hypothetical protein
MNLDERAKSIQRCSPRNENNEIARITVRKEEMELILG